MTLKNSPVADDLLATPIARTSARSLSDSGSPDTDFTDVSSSKNGRDEDFNATLMQIQEFSHTLHERNQKRIKAGLWCIAIIPMIFLILLLHMESSKVVYLLLWVISLFLISAYLVTVAYIDDQMQKKLKQRGLDLKEGHDYLVQDLPSRLNNNLQSIITAAKEIKL